MGGGRQGGESGPLREETAGLHSGLEPSNFSTSAGIYPEGLFFVCFFGGGTPRKPEREHGLWAGTTGKELGLKVKRDILNVPPHGEGGDQGLYGLSLSS